jgi:hypothetical protein
MVRGICVDNVKNYLFALGFDDGEFVVYDLGKPGRETGAKEVAKMKNKPKVRPSNYIRAGKFVGLVSEVKSTWGMRMVQ